MSKSFFAGFQISKNFAQLFAAVNMVCCLNSAFALDQRGNFESIQEQDAFISTTLKKFAREINEQTPLQLDGESKLMSVFAYQKTINFNVLLPLYKFSEIEKNQLDKLISENLNHRICKTKASRDLIDLGVEFVYFYSGNDGKLITRIAIKGYLC